MNSFIRKIILAPLLLLCPAFCAAGTEDGEVPSAPEDGDILADIDYEALGRIVDGRTARAEKGVLRDYFARIGLEGGDAALAEERYRLFRSRSRPDKRTVEELERRCSEAEKHARELETDCAARVQMARMGVDESCAEDVLVLARRQLERGGKDLSADPGDAPGLMRRAVEEVLGRLPQLASGGRSAGTGQALGSGSAGNFPRNGGGNVLQQQLDSLRAAGDTVSAVALINSAAEKGIALR